MISTTGSVRRDKVRPGSPERECIMPVLLEMVATSKGYDLQ